MVAAIDKFLNKGISAKLKLMEKNKKGKKGGSRSKEKASAVPKT